jgi:hypothetical protein
MDEDIKKGEGCLKGKCIYVYRKAAAGEAFASTHVSDDVVIPIADW